jgi:DMSO/TMAO reductase YedYZ molybdopterin-dependent catalytic subunit
VTGRQPPPGPFRRQFWRSPLRGPWLASILGSALLPLIVICALTGFLSQAAYDPGLGDNSQLPGGGIGIDLYFFSWPTSPSWIYAFTQGLHVISGVAAIPLLLAKLWSAMPKLFEWPPVRSLAHSLERASLAFLVGGSIFVFFTGLLNIQLYYPWSFSFVPAHYYGAFIFLGALALHVTLKLPIVSRAFQERGVIRPLRDDLAHTRPEPPREDSTAPANPTVPTMSRRALLGTVAAGSAGLGTMAAGQVIGGPLRNLALLAPRGQKLGSGPNDFQINKTAKAAGISVAETGPDWRLALHGTRQVALSREELMAMARHTHDLTIGCVEGWSTTQSWTGVRLRDLASIAGAPEGSEVEVSSLQRGGGFSHAVLSSGQIADERSLLALKVNGADLSLDHGYPARVIVPGAPGVHNTKWVSSMTFRGA